MFVVPKFRLSVILVAGMLCVSAVYANVEWADVGQLKATKLKDGWTSETYSDGYTAKYNLQGERDESTLRGRRITMSLPGSSMTAEEWVKEYLYFPPSSRAPNDSAMQSRLRQYIEICLANQHGIKAFAEAGEYRDIQQRIHAKGLPLAISEELLGRVYSQCGYRNEALLHLNQARNIAKNGVTTSEQKMIARYTDQARKATFRLQNLDNNYESGQKLKILELQAKADILASAENITHEGYRVNEQLLAPYLREADWANLNLACKRLIELQNKYPELREPKTGCVLPITTRLDCYLGAAKSDYKLGHRDEAEKVLRRAQVELKDVTVRELERLAEMEVEFGNFSGAKIDLEKAAKLRGGSRSEEMEFLYKRMGEPTAKMKKRNTEPWR